MTIYRDLKPIKKYTFTTGTDTYGQKRQLGSTYVNIMATIKPFSHNNVDNPLFVDVQLIGLTKATITDENQVEIDNVKYDVVYVQKNPRQTEFYMVKAK